MTTRKSAILMPASTMTRTSVPLTSGLLQTNARLAERAIRQAGENGGRGRHLVEQARGRGVVAGQAEAVSQRREDPPDRVGLARRPDRGADPLRAPLEIHE